MQAHQASAHARQARDDIVDLLLDGQQAKAIVRYVEASGVAPPEAGRVIARLGEVLAKPGLDADEQAFLADFRATLDRLDPARHAPATRPTSATEDRHAENRSDAAPASASLGSRRVSTSNRLWGVGALLLCLAGLYFVGRNLFLAAGQDTWLPVPAVVLTAHRTTSTKGSGGAVNVNFHFRYEYEVDGTRHIGDRYSFWSLGGNQGAGVERFRPGARITVYHHPQWHDQAVVERIAPSFFTWITLPLLLLVAAPAAWMVWTGKSNG